MAERQTVAMAETILLSLPSATVSTHCFQLPLLVHSTALCQGQCTLPSAHCLLPWLVHSAILPRLVHLPWPYYSTLFHLPQLVYSAFCHGQCTLPSAILIQSAVCHGQCTLPSAILIQSAVCHGQCTLPSAMVSTLCHLPQLVHSPITAVSAVCHRHYFPWCTHSVHFCSTLHSRFILGILIFVAVL